MSGDGWWRDESLLLSVLAWLGWVSMSLLYVRTVASCGYRCVLWLLCVELLLLGCVCEGIKVVYVLCSGVAWFWLCVAIGSMHVMCGRCVWVGSSWRFDLGARLGWGLCSLGVALY